MAPDLFALPYLRLDRSSGTTLVPARQHSLKSLCSCREERWALSSGSILGTRNLHGPMVSLKILAAESANYGANNVPQSRCWFHPLPSCNTRFTKNLTAHLSEMPDCRVRRSEGPPSASNGKLMSSVLSLKGSLDSRGHSWAKSTPGNVGYSLPGQMFQVSWPEMQTESTWRGSAKTW